MGKDVDIFANVKRCVIAYEFTHLLTSSCFLLIFRYGYSVISSNWLFLAL